jgi:hypothetical protein
MKRRRRTMTSEGRTGNEIKDTRVYQVIDQIIWENPDLSRNTWLMHRKGIIETIEDEGERAPPLSMIFNSESKENGPQNSSGINIMELMTHRPFLIIGGRR